MVSVLPEPLSPDDPDLLARLDVEAHAADDLVRAASALDTDVQIANREDGGHVGAPVVKDDGRWALSRVDQLAMG